MKLKDNSLSLDPGYNSIEPLDQFWLFEHFFNGESRVKNTP